MVKVIFQERNGVCAVSESGWSMYEINFIKNPRLLPKNPDALKRIFRFTNSQKQSLDVTFECSYPTEDQQFEFNKLCDEFKTKFIEKTLSNDAFSDRIEIPASNSNGKIIVFIYPDASGL